MHRHTNTSKGETSLRRLLAVHSLALILYLPPFRSKGLVKTRQRSMLLGRISFEKRGENIKRGFALLYIYLERGPKIGGPLSQKSVPNSF
jgi:hypothetical protein